MVKGFGVAAGGEIAARGGIHQGLDLRVYPLQVALDAVHGGGNLGLLTGQALHVHREVAHRVAFDHLHHLHLHGDMGLHQSVDGVRHVAVDAREAGRVDLLVDHAQIVLVRVLPLGVHKAAKGANHLLQGFQELACLVPRRNVDVLGQGAGGDCLTDGDSLAQGADDAAADPPGGQRPRDDHPGGEQSDHPGGAADGCVEGLAGCAGICRLGVDQGRQCGANRFVGPGDGLVHVADGRPAGAQFHGPRHSAAVADAAGPDLAERRLGLGADRAKGAVLVGDAFQRVHALGEFGRVVAAPQDRILEIVDAIAEHGLPAQGQAFPRHHLCFVRTELLLQRVQVVDGVDRHGEAEGDHEAEAEGQATADGERLHGVILRVGLTAGARGATSMR